MKKKHKFWIFVILYSLVLFPSMFFLILWLSQFTRVGGSFGILIGLLWILGVFIIGKKTDYLFEII